jgi:hypothetical protein
VILLTDATVAPSLRLEIGQLTNDLIGDGWKVLYHEVPRHDDNVWTNNPPRIQQTKSIVQADYNLAPGDTNVLFLLGHVAVPYSGTSAADGHECGTDVPRPWHSGAWPCDGYYAELTGTAWSDSALVSTCDFRENANAPGDGKWDANEFASPLELAFGRVDFARMTAFGVNPPVGTNADPREVALLRQYLQKDHRYRHKLTLLDFSAAEAAVLASYFGLNRAPSLDLADRTSLANGLRTASSWFGFGSMKAVEGDIF